MRWTAVTAALVAGLTLCFVSAPADAAKKRGARSADARPTARYVVRQRPRARITVRRARSFLDPGTEVLPMSRSYTDYAIPPMHSAYDIADPTRSRRTPLPEPYYLPGYDRSGLGGY